MRFSQYPPLLGNTSIRIKVLIPSAILILALTVVSLLAVYGLGVQRAALGEVHDIALKKIALVDEFAILSEQVQSDVFHISVLRFMNLPEEEIQPVHQRLERGLNDLNVIYGQMLTKWPLDEAERSILKRMKGPMDDFRHQAEQAVAVVSDNPSFGVLLVRSSTVPFTEFRNTLTEFLAHQEASIVRTETESRQRTNTIGTFIIAITLVIALIGTFVTTLISTRLISHPIRSMTDLMRRLADGDLSIKVEGIERQDEIGAMAQAVEVFRQNATEKAQATNENPA
ncbi:MAG: HAMP domain-containing protein [Anaerolineae bacterium]